MKTTKNLNICLIVFLIITSKQALAYNIDVHSPDSLGLSGAYRANVQGADAAHFNPAAMIWQPSEYSLLDAGFSYLHLPKTEFTGTVSQLPASSTTQSEDFFLPTLFYVSPLLKERWRYGFSLISPAGLTTRWEGLWQKALVEEISLKTVELSSSLAYRVNNTFSVGAAVRITYGEAQLISSLPAGLHPVLVHGYKQNMKGDDIQPGYQLSLSWKPTGNIALAAVYRAKVVLGLDGEASGFTSLPVAPDTIVNYPYTTAGKTSVPIPAILSLGAAYTFGETSLEVVYERLFWSAYERLDFNYQDAAIEQVFGMAQEKKWHDSNYYRLGIRHNVSNQLSLMMGIGLGETFIPDETLDFDLPGSRVRIYSLGLRYRLNPDTSLGIAYVHQEQDERSLNNGGRSGSFSGGGGRMFNFSLGYRF